MPTSTSSVAEPDLISLADERFGYRFGCDGLMTVGEAARFLGMSRWTLARRIDEGRIRRGRDGRRVVICRRSVADYVAGLEE